MIALWQAGDAVARTTALLLLLMSVAAWAVIGWKWRRLARARADIQRAVPAFWAAATVADGQAVLQHQDREGLLQPLLAAATAASAAGTLEAAAQPASQLTRRLRDALHAGLARLQAGQVLLASVGSTAPFVGLFGTVWGIYKALADMAGTATTGAEGVQAAMGIAQVSGPIGEALLMTAAGIAVAVPAVLAYNAFGHQVAACEAELEGFAFDLRDWLTGHPAPADAQTGTAA